MEPIKVEILLPKSCYYAGETISGTVSLQVPLDQSPFQATYFDLSLRGVVGCGEMEQKEFHSNEEEQLWVPREMHRHRQDLLLLKCVHQIPKGTINPGSHMTFPFSVQLREKLLSSIELPHGYVRYWIFVMFPELLSTRHPPIGYKKVRVFDIVDPNTPESLKNGPQIAWSHETNCCGASKLSLTAQFDRSVYMPGEIIRATCFIDSHYGQKLTPHILLGRTVTYHLLGDRGKSETHHYHLKAPPGMASPVISEYFRGKHEIVALLPFDISETHHKEHLNKHHPSRHPNENPSQLYLRQSGYDKNVPTTNHPIIQMTTVATIGFGLSKTDDPRPPPVEIILGTVPFRGIGVDHPVTSQQLRQPALLVADETTEKQLQAAYENPCFLPKLTHLPDDYIKKFGSDIEKMI